MSNLLTRTLTGVVFVLIIIGSIIWKQQIFSIVFFAVTIIGQIEFYKLIRSDHWKPNSFSGVIMGSVLFITSALVAGFYVSPYILLINFPVVFSFFIGELFSRSPNPFMDIASTLLGVIYIALPFSLLNFFFNPLMYVDSYYVEILLGFFSILWISDSAAYLVGSSLGKHPLFKRISPKKTWEGSIGGLLFGLLSAYIFSLFFDLFSLQEWFIFALIIIVFSTLGDLTESMLKRSIGIKDSGKILPGHGGILDRFDGALIAIPFTFIYLLIIL